MNREIRGLPIELAGTWSEEVIFLDAKDLKNRHLKTAFNVASGPRQSKRMSERPNLCGPRTTCFLANSLFNGRILLTEVLAVGEKLQALDEDGMLIADLTRVLDKLDSDHKILMLSPKKQYRNLEYIKWLVDVGGVMVAGSWELDQNDTDEHIVSIIGYSQNGELVIADSSFRGSINSKNKDFENMGFYKIKYKDFVKRWFWSRYGFRVEEGNLMAEGGWDNMPALAVWPRNQRVL